MSWFSELPGVVQTIIVSIVRFPRRVILTILQILGFVVGTLAVTVWINAYREHWVHSRRQPVPADEKAAFENLDGVSRASVELTRTPDPDLPEADRSTIDDRGTLPSQVGRGGKGSRMRGGAIRRSRGVSGSVTRTFTGIERHLTEEKNTKRYQPLNSDDDDGDIATIRNNRASRSSMNPIFDTEIFEPRPKESFRPIVARFNSRKDGGNEDINVGVK